MRILHFITSLRTGGAEHLVVDLLREMRAAGHDAALLLMDGTRTPLYDEAEADGIPVHSLSEGWKSMRDPRLLKDFVGFLKQGKWDIVHTHNTACQLLGAAASKRLPLTLVTTEHNTFNRRRRWRWYKPVDRWMYGRYRHVICVGEDVKDGLLAVFPGLEPRVSVIPNGISISRFSGATPAADLRGEGETRVLMVSAFRPQKDQPTLIRALQELPETFRLFLAGGAETEEDRKYLASCHELVDALGLQDRVTFLGVRSDVSSLMAASQILVLSTHYEGAPLTAIEAMASGKPVVASDVSGVRSLLLDAGLLFPEGDSSALASLLKELSSDAVLSARIGERCRRRASAYDVVQTALRYLDLYARSGSA